MVWVLVVFNLMGRVRLRDVCSRSERPAGIGWLQKVSIFPYLIPPHTDIHKQANADKGRHQ